MSLGQLAEEREELLVVVATRMISPLVEQLQKEGFKYIVLKQQLDGQLLECTPALSQKERWI